MEIDITIGNAVVIFGKICSLIIFKTQNLIFLATWMASFTIPPVRFRSPLDESAFVKVWKVWKWRLYIEFGFYWTYIIPFTGCPKKRTFRMLLGHSTLAQSEIDSTLCVWKLFFLSFLTKTKPDQAFPSHVHHKI